MDASHNSTLPQRPRRPRGRPPGSGPRTPLDFLCAYLTAYYAEQEAAAGCVPEQRRVARRMRISRSGFFGWRQMLGLPWPPTPRRLAACPLAQEAADVVRGLGIDLSATDLRARADHGAGPAQTAFVARVLREPRFLTWVALAELLGVMRRESSPRQLATLEPSVRRFRRTPECWPEATRPPHRRA